MGTMVSITVDIMESITGIISRLQWDVADGNYNSVRNSKIETGK